MIVSELFARALARDPAGPLITYYDDGTGERTEVSATTLDNWVAKTANFLTDGLGLDDKSSLAVLLPPHWQTAGILLGAWAAGHLVRDFPDVDVADQPDVVFCTEPELTSYADLACDVVGVTLDPWGRGLSQQWRRITDYAAEIGTYGDQYLHAGPVDPNAEALRAGSMLLTQQSLVETAEELASRLGMDGGGRILVGCDLAATAGPASWLLAPLAAGSSVVLVTDARSDRLPARAASEHITATLGIQLPGVAVLGG